MRIKRQKPAAGLNGDQQNVPAQRKLLAECKIQDLIIDVIRGKAS
jgi:hypothetical protein